MKHRPETRARAVLALLDPWLKRTDLGLSYGDQDLTGARRRLASLVSRVRAVALRSPLENGPRRSERAEAAARHDAIDALLTFARTAKASGISTAEVTAKTAEVDAGELAALALADRFFAPLHDCDPPPRRRMICLPDPPPGPDVERGMTPAEIRAATEAVGTGWAS